MPLRRILLVHREGNAFNNPTLKAFIDFGLRCGISFDIVGRRHLSAQPETHGVRWLSYGPYFAKIKSLGTGRFGTRLSAWLLVVAEMMLFVAQYDLIVGVDREGVIDASILSRLLQVPYVFFSFEIMFESETGKYFKDLERHASRLCGLWLVQDAGRAACLAREDGLDEENCFICPVASAGRADEPTERLRDQLRIPAAQKVAITIGSVERWTLAAEVIQSTLQWPDDWVLIVHERYGQAERLLPKAVLRRINKDGQRLYISHHPVDAVDDLASVLAGVDVGLGFYAPDFQSPWTGKNLAHLGRSSGKIATYLRHGVPVIVNQIGLYAQDVADFGFGVVLDRPDDIAMVLGEHNWQQFRGAAYDYFAEVLDASRYMPALFERLEQIAAGA